MLPSSKVEGVSSMGQQGSHQARETVLAVSGMTCGGCASTVTRILSRVPGVAEAKVDFATGRATIKGEAPPAELISAVEAAGYGAKDARSDAQTGGSNGGD
jgi:copper chaperone CopZ